MNEGTPTPPGDKPPQIHAGMRLDFFRPGGVWALSAAKMNPLVAAANAFLNLKVKISEAQPQGDGSVTPSGELKIADLNSTLELKLAPHTDSGGGTTTTTPMHPFKIYNFPSALRVFHPADEARRFKVRAGVDFRFADDGSAPYGSDRETHPDEPDTFTTFQTPPPDGTSISNLVTGSYDWNEAIIPADGNTYWFWFSTCSYGTTYPNVIRYGNTTVANITACTNLYSGDSENEIGFDPTEGSDPYRLVIGSVTIYPSAAPGIKANYPYIRQRVKSDFQMNGGLLPLAEYCGRGYVGAYAIGNYYFIGDIVSVTETVNGYYILSLYTVGDSAANPIDAGPIIGLDPTTDATSTWTLICRGPAAGFYQNGPFDGSVGYFGTP